MKKYFAPVVIVGVILTWLIFQMLNLFTVFRIFGESISMMQKVILIGGIFLFAVALVSVLIQRIMEIKNQNEDDFRKY